MIRITPVVKNILILNVAIFVLDSFLLNGLLTQFGALRFVLADAFNITQFLAYMWLHGGFMHIFFNMLMLFFIGPILENLWGGKRFLIYYLVTGIGAGVLYGGVQFARIYPDIAAAKNYIENPTPEAFEYFAVEKTADHIRVRNSGTISNLIDTYNANPGNEQVKANTIQFAMEIHDAAIQAYDFDDRSKMVGASGAVYGLLIAVALLFPNMQVMLLFPPIPMKMKYLALGLAAFAIYSEFNRSEGDNVAHLAHLGGMLIGFILLKIWKSKSNTYY
ncbi:MAG: rhomboid family intramembrane serine protease [Cyclobacteriaceae bacterium]